MFKSRSRKVELLLAIPEHKVALRGSSLGASQNDVFALLRADDLTFAITIEGKINEPFGEELGGIHNASQGKKERLEYLCETLGLTQLLLDDIPYHLLHRPLRPCSKHSASRPMRQL